MATFELPIQKLPITIKYFLDYERATYEAQEAKKKAQEAKKNNQIGFLLLTNNGVSIQNSDEDRSALILFKEKNIAKKKIKDLSHIKIWGEKIEQNSETYVYFKLNTNKETITISKEKDNIAADQNDAKNYSSQNQHQIVLRF